jgi:hypothetical protein
MAAAQREMLPPVRWRGKVERPRLGLRVVRRGTRQGIRSSSAREGLGVADAWPGGRTAVMPRTGQADEEPSARTQDGASVKTANTAISMRRIALGLSLALGGLSVLSLWVGARVVGAACLDETQWRIQRAKFSRVMPSSEFSSCDGCYAWQNLGGDLIFIGLCLAVGAMAIGGYLVATRWRAHRLSTERDVL